MQKLNWWLVSGLVGGGMIIFFFSLYTASLAGLKRQLGLVGGDLSQSVDLAKLYRGMIDVETMPSCDYWQAVRPIPRYVFSSDLERIGLGRELAKRRAECAIVYTMAGNIERGVYTLLKSLRYQQAGLLALESEVNLDKELCQAYQSSVTFGYIEAYLDAARGNVRDIIEREYLEVQRLNEKLIEMCAN